MKIDNIEIVNKYRPDDEKRFALLPRESPLPHGERIRVRGSSADTFTLTPPSLGKGEEDGPLYR
jgi:hypothetical protein